MRGNAIFSVARIMGVEFPSLSIRKMDMSANNSFSIDVSKTGEEPLQSLFITCKCVSCLLVGQTVEMQSFPTYDAFPLSLP